MQPKRVIIGHSWIDVSVNIQTKAVAFALSIKARIWFFTQSRIRQALPNNTNLVVQEWPNKRPTRWKDFVFAVRQVQKIKPDLIIVHFASTKALLFAGWLCGVKYRVAWYHTLAAQAKLEAGGKYKAFIDILIRTLTYRMATHVITFTPHATHDATQEQYIRAAKLYTIPNGLEAPVSRKVSYRYTAEKFTFLYVGRLTATKGCDILINVFATLTKKYRHLSLQIVGKGEEEVLLQQLIAEKNLQGNVLLSGPASSYVAVYENMLNAYALLVPSRVDNYPTVILEAMACGLPVIGANAGGIPYMIEHGVDGFICNDEKDWVEKCELLVNTAQLRNSMAANARDAFEKKYTIEHHVKRVMDFIHHLPD